jgi:hypothetical protein
MSIKKDVAALQRLVNASIAALRNAAASSGNSMGGAGSGTNSGQPTMMQTGHRISTGLPITSQFASMQLNPSMISSSTGSTTNSSNSSTGVGLNNTNNSGSGSLGGPSVSDVSSLSSSSASIGSSSFNGNLARAQNNFDSNIAASLRTFRDQPLASVPNATTANTNATGGVNGSSQYGSSSGNSLRQSYPSSR